MVTASFDISPSQSVHLDSLTTDIGAGTDTATRDDTYERFYFTSISAVALVFIVGNLIVIIVMLRTERLRTPTNYFMISLAVSDLTQGVVYPLYNFGYIPGFVLAKVFGEYAINVFCVTSTKLIFKSQISETFNIVQYALLVKKYV